MNDTIFRIQTPDGGGVYRGNNWVNIENYIDDSNPDSHPSPKNDSELKKNAPHLFFAGFFDAEHFVFGFKSIAQLKAWFYNDDLLKLFHKNGFEIVELAGEIYHGNSQSIINRDTSKKIKTINILDICS